jgi:hypothetical protein
MCLSSCLFGERYKPVPIHVVMVDNELYFVLEKAYEVGGVVVDISTTTSPPYEVPPVIKWNAGCAEKGKFLKLRQIKYGQDGEGFTTWISPKELQKNVRYTVRIGTNSGVWAGAEFVITDDNKIIIYSSIDSKSIKNRTVAIERNGEKIVVPYSVTSNNFDHSVVIISKPISEQ